jgi:hypothetical protein
MDFNVYPGRLIQSSDEKSSVLLCHGQLAIGFTVAQAREVSEKLARAADDVEFEIAKRRNP